MFFYRPGVSNIKFSSKNPFVPWLHGHLVMLKSSGDKQPSHNDTIKVYWGKSFQNKTQTKTDHIHMDVLACKVKEKEFKHIFMHIRGKLNEINKNNNTDSQ